MVSLAKAAKMRCPEGQCDGSGFYHRIDPRANSYTTTACPCGIFSSDSEAAKDYGLFKKSGLKYHDWKKTYRPAMDGLAQGESIKFYCLVDADGFPVSKTVHCYNCAVPENRRKLTLETEGILIGSWREFEPGGPPKSCVICGLTIVL